MVNSYPREVLMDTTADAAPTPAGQIRHTPDGYILAFDKQFDYPRAHIWNLLSDPAKIRLWLGRLNPGWELGKEYSLRLGGGEAVGTVLQLNPPTSLQITWEDELGQESVIEWRVLSSDAGALLQFRAHSGTPDFLTEGAAGWQQLLEAMANVAAGRETDDDGTGSGTGTGGNWLQLRDAYSREFGFSHSMGFTETVDGVPMVHFDRRYEAPLPLVNDAITADPERQPMVEQAEVDLARAGSHTTVSVRHVLEDTEDPAEVLADWHAHLDAVRTRLDGDTPHASGRRRRALIEFYRRTSA